jgi:exopolysaccharide production protein ExoQ
MPPPLALFLCTVFVLFLLKLEGRRSVGLSGATWVPTVWMLAIASKPLGIWFGLGGDAESGSTLDRMFLLTLLTASWLIIVKRRLDWLAVLRANKLLVALLAYMLVSTLWSDITAIALRRWVRVAIVIAMALVVLSETKPRQALESVLRRSAYILIPYSLILIKYYPTLGVDYGRWSGLQMWIGVTVHKNTLGRLCLISAFFIIWALCREWSAQKSSPAVDRSQHGADLLVLFIALLLLKGADGAYSATSLGTFALGITVMWGMHLQRRWNMRAVQVALLALVVLLLVIGTSAPFLGGANISVISALFGRDETLTGRTQTWLSLVPVVMAEPFFGSGVGSFWTTARRGLYDMSYGHNGYLDTLLELGAVGLLLYVLWLLSCVRNFCQALKTDYHSATFAICVLLMCIVHNITESSLSDFAEQMTAIVVLTSVVVSAQRADGTSVASTVLSRRHTARSKFAYERKATISYRSHHSLHLHLSPQRSAGEAAPKPRSADYRRPVRLFARGR